MNKVERPWGTQIVWASTGNYTGSSIIIKEGEETPYIYHKIRDKTIFIVQGVLNLTIEGSNKLLQEGDSYHISPKIMHKFHAIKGDVTILEAGTGLEDDIVVVKE